MSRVKILAGGHVLQSGACKKKTTAYDFLLLTIKIKLKANT